MLSCSKCEHCNTPFFHKRSDAKFCSARCRKLNHIKLHPEAPAQWKARYLAKQRAEAPEVCPC